MNPKQALMLALLAGLGALAGLLLAPLGPWLAGSSAAVTLGAAPTCDPVTTLCVAGDGQSSIGLRFRVQPTPLRAFPLDVTLTGPVAATAEAVSVRFHMADMNMGFNLFKLRRENGLWRGEALLPVCGAGRQDWRATVRVEGGPGYGAEFDFTVGS